MQRKPPDSSRRRSRDRRRERRHAADRRAVVTGFEGEERRKGERRHGPNRRADDPHDYYPEEVERIRTNVVQHLKAHRGPAPRYSCPRCPGFLTVHRPVHWAEVTVFEVTCSGCSRRAVIKETPTGGTRTSWLKGLLRRLFS